MDAAATTSATTTTLAPGGNRSDSGEEAPAHVAVHLGDVLEEAGVDVEDVARVGITTGGTAEEEGHLAVGHSLLGEVVVEDNGVLDVAAEVLAMVAPV